MINLWYRFLTQFIAFTYFNRIELLHPERIPQDGKGILFLALHRNGALDGAVYTSRLPKIKIMIAARLRKSLVGRLFFSGIEVVRAQDKGDRSGNENALNHAIHLLNNGGQLCVFPEGTSSLGPTHLPFKSGAMRIATQATDAHLIPIGIHYEAPTYWQRNVSIVVGQPLTRQQPSQLTEAEQIDLMMERMEQGLHEVGINVIDQSYLDKIMQIAYIATLGTKISYFSALKQLEKSIPQPILTAWEQLEKEQQQFATKLKYHQTVPLFPEKYPFLYLLLWLILTPFILLAGILNLLPLTAGHYASQRFPDEPNVISLWKAMAGNGLFLIQLIITLLIALLTNQWLFYSIYLLITFIGLKLYYRWLKLGVASYNGIRFPHLAEKGWALRKTILNHIKE